MEDNDKLKELFESISTDILNEEMQLKLGVLFEEAVNSAIAAKEQELDESNATEIEKFKSELVEQMDEYLDYFCREYIKENEQVVEDYTKVKLAEKVLRNFHQMTEAFNISLSEESVSSEDELEELQAQNTKLVNKLIESRKEIEMVTKAALISEASTKLDTDMQRERLVEMAKNLEFDAELFESKLNVLVDTIKAKEEKPEDIKESLEIKEEKVVEEVKTKVPSDVIAKYLNKF